MIEKCLLKQFGFVASFDRCTEVGEYYKVGENEVCVNHDTQYVFLTIDGEFTYIGELK